MQHNPSMQMCEVTRILANRWAIVSPEEKAACEELAAGDKQRYENQMQVYSAKQAAGAVDPLAEGMGETGPVMDGGEAGGAAAGEEELGEQMEMQGGEAAQEEGLAHYQEEGAPAEEEGQVE